MASAEALLTYLLPGESRMLKLWHLLSPTSFSFFDRHTQITALGAPTKGRDGRYKGYELKPRADNHSALQETRHLEANQSHKKVLFLLLQPNPMSSQSHDIQESPTHLRSFRWQIIGSEWDTDWWTRRRKSSLCREPLLILTDKTSRDMHLHFQVFTGWHHTEGLIKVLSGLSGKCHIIILECLRWRPRNIVNDFTRQNKFPRWVRNSNSFTLVFFRV